MRRLLVWLCAVQDMLSETNHVDSEGGTYIVVVLSTEDGTVDVLLLSTEDGTVDVLLLSTENGTVDVLLLSTENSTVDVLLLSTEDGTVDVLLLSTEINECEEWIVRVSTQAVCLFGQFILAQKLHHCTIDRERQLPSAQVD